jgi:SPP1 gp7 family putative phage head morphogenesis protein
MKKAEQAIADKIIAHHIQLMRYTAGEKQKVFNILMQMQMELKAKLQNGLTSYEKARVAKVLNQCTVLIDRYYSGIQTQMNLTGLAKTEGEATVKAMASIGIEGSLPAPSVFKAMISDTLLTGAPLADWWEKLGQDVSFKVVSQVRQGIAQGETLQDIITRVVGNPKKGIAGVMEASRRNASTLVHDTVMRITNDAKMAVYRQNSDVVKGVEQLSTLDSKTSDICIAYSGAKWDLDGEPIGGTTLPFDGGPPRHPNCRSVLVPVLIPWKELGVNVEPPKGTRASDLGPVPADMSFDAFLKRHDKEYQDELLGKGKADLWRSGKISLRDLISQDGRPMTLKDLRAGL